MTPHGRMNIPINRVQYVQPQGARRLRHQLDAIFWVCFFTLVIFGLMWATTHL